MQHDISTIVFPLYGREIRFAVPYVAQIGALLRNLNDAELLVMESSEARYGKKIEYIVDVGACVGSTIIPYTIPFSGAEILALEPSQYNYKFLQFNCKDIPNAKLLKMAAHNETGSIQIASPTFEQKQRADRLINTGLVSVYGASDDFRETVPAVALDELIDRKVDWLKVDVEGHEQAVLEGATRIIAEDRPILQIEAKEQNQDMGPYTLSSLAKLIGDAGYVLIGKKGIDLVFLPKELWE